MKKYEAPVVDIDIFVVGDVMAAYTEEGGDNTCTIFDPTCGSATPIS